MRIGGQHADGTISAIPVAGTGACGEPDSSSSGAISSAGTVASTRTGAHAFTHTGSDPATTVLTVANADT